MFNFSEARELPLAQQEAQWIQQAQKTSELAGVKPQDLATTKLLKEAQALYNISQNIRDQKALNNPHMLRGNYWQ